MPEKSEVKADKVDNLIVAIPPEQIEETLEDQKAMKGDPIKPKGQKLGDSVVLVPPEEVEKVETTLESSNGDPIKPKGQKLGDSVVLVPPEEAEKIETTSELLNEDSESLEEEKIVTPVTQEEPLSHSGKEQAEFEVVVKKLKSLAYWQRQQTFVNKIDSVALLQRLLREVWPKQGNQHRIIAERIEQLQANA